VPEALAGAMNVTATDFPYGVDEFAAAGLTKVSSERVAPPRIVEAPVAMECRLDQIHEVGRGRTAIIVGEILLWHVRDDLIVEGRLDMGRLDAVGRMSGASYARTRDLFTLTRPRQPPSVDAPKKT
jgi:flavin reductase (DIM6/NTAB) family NADH-FMN oxidoreductase RutF